MTFKFTWYGHSAIGIETGSYHLLVDPYFRNNPAASSTASELQPDFILITHGHGDHVGDTIEIARSSDAMVISNYEIAKWLSAKGLKTHGLATGGGHRFPFGTVKLTNALHGSMLPDGSYGGTAAGFLLTLPDDRKIYLAGDTGLFGDMRLIGEEGITLTALPIGDNYTMGPADALRAIHFLNAQHCVPIHYNTHDFIKQDAPAWARTVEAQTACKVHVLAPGQTLEL